MKTTINPIELGNDEINAILQELATEEAERFDSFLLEDEDFELVSIDLDTEIERFCNYLD